MPPVDFTGQGNNEPAQKGFPIAPDDVTDLAILPRNIYVGGTGTVTVLMRDDTLLLFTGVPTGAVLNIRPKRVMLTGTTATGLIGLY